MNFYKKRSLGQHFLVDNNLSARIVEAAVVGPNDTVIEIGPGRGALTQHFSSYNPKRVVLIDLDVRCCQELRRHYPKYEVVNADAANFDLNSIAKDSDEQFVVVSNLPYNASTAILDNLISSRGHIYRMVLMFQKEVAERVMAEPCNADYGRLTLLSKEFYDVKKLFILKPSAFSPPPKVDSMVVTLNRRAEPLFEILDRRFYDRLVKQVFSNRRKMLRRSLKGVVEPGILDLIAADCGIDLEKRPQDLDPKEFAKLANFITSLNRQ